MSGSESDADIKGVWRPANSAAATPAFLRMNAEAMVSVAGSADGAVIAQASLSDLTISDRVGSIPRHLGFPGGGDFETRDNDAVDAVSRRLGRGAGLVHGLEAFRPRLLAFVAITIALCFALYRFAVPALVEVAVWSTPPAVSDLIGKSVMITLDQLAFEDSTLPQARRKAIGDAFTEISSLTPRGAAASAAGTAMPYTLHFRRGGSIGPNAFALPDGSVVLTDELVELSKDDEMILGVLAHEIGHVEHQHSLRQLYRVAGVAALIMLIGGDIGAATEDMLTQGAALLALSHSRGAEAEADRHSVELMHRAGRDPAAIARFFELLREKFGPGGEVDILSTHPATEERIEETRRYAKEVAGR